ncbi:hypothetical protein C8F01DRAFT_1266765 [Mycena amicta]|nr:hypothetical protein C8F01DRAFT_1266765 [Mycena amicta]
MDPPSGKISLLPTPRTTFRTARLLDDVLDDDGPTDASKILKHDWGRLATLQHSSGRRSQDQLLHLSWIADPDTSQWWLHHHHHPVRLDAEEAHGMDEKREDSGQGVIELYPPLSWSSSSGPTAIPSSRHHHDGRGHPFLGAFLLKDKTGDIITTWTASLTSRIGSQIPWGSHTPENFSLKHAQEVLDADHYGLADVKVRILEFLAVSKLRLADCARNGRRPYGDCQPPKKPAQDPPAYGPAWCRQDLNWQVDCALGRQFFRVNVGGLTDVAEIKGHRRTYVEVVGRGINGDPSSALLEMLDPEQNDGFIHGHPVYLSSILFVCTANALSTISAPPLDLMEVIEVSGCVTEETAIASRFLKPQAETRVVLWVRTG